MNAAITKRIKVWAPVMAAAFLVGCAGISENTHAYLGVPRYPPGNPALVQVLASEPKQPTERLGEILLTVNGNPSRQKLEEKLKVAAAKLGADGVFIASDKTHIYPMAYWDCCGPVVSEDYQRVVVGVAFKNK